MVQKVQKVLPMNWEVKPEGFALAVIAGVRIVLSLSDVSAVGDLEGS